MSRNVSQAPDRPYDYLYDNKKKKKKKKEINNINYYYNYFFKYINIYKLLYIIIN